jgi:TatD DNase family protein
MFDTHCHLNFSRFKKNVDEVVDTAINTGVKGMVIPGTDIQSSRKAIELAQKYAQNGLDIWAAVGIHPHHVYEHKEDSDELAELEKLLNEDRVVAVGEIGLDRHQYEQTKYEAYHVDERFIEAQKKLFQAQFELAIKHKKSLIMHNRERQHSYQILIQVQPNIKFCHFVAIRTLIGQRKTNCLCVRAASVKLRRKLKITHQKIKPLILPRRRIKIVVI